MKIKRKGKRRRHKFTRASKDGQMEAELYQRIKGRPKRRQYLPGYQRKAKMEAIFTRVSKDGQMEAEIIRASKDGHIEAGTFQGIKEWPNGGRNLSGYYRIAKCRQEFTRVLRGGQMKA